MVELGQAVNSAAVQLDARDESDCLPIVGVAQSDWSLRSECISHRGDHDDPTYAPSPPPLQVDPNRSLPNNPESLVKIFELSYHYPTIT